VLFRSKDVSDAVAALSAARVSVSRRPQPCSAAATGAAARARRMVRRRKVMGARA